MLVEKEKRSQRKGFLHALAAINQDIEKTNAQYSSPTQMTAVTSIPHHTSLRKRTIGEQVLGKRNCRKLLWKKGKAS